MKLKRTLALVFVLVLALGSVAVAEGNDRIVLGGIDIAGADEIIERFFPGQYEVVLFPTTNEVLIALKSGRIEAAFLTEDYASFLLQSDDTLTYEVSDMPPSLLTMLARDTDTELIAALNEAIATLKESGTLDALYETYIVSASPDNIPQTPAAVKIDGAREVIVGVSGDFPPHDYVSIAGTPAGFNVALMQEIAAIAGINVKYETVTFGSKFAALESGRIDLFFLHAGLTHFDGITQTEAYAEGIYPVFLTVK